MYVEDWRAAVTETHSFKLYKCIYVVPRFSYGSHLAFVNNGATESDQT